MGQEIFDKQLARECALSFSETTGVGCTLSDKTGEVFADYGYSCEKCELCSAMSDERSGCIQANIYGMMEAERFGGKYIYFCPKGLTCFVSPIVSEDGAQAKITVGPLIMVEKQDFIDCEIKDMAGLEGPALERALRALDSIPVISPHRVEQMATLLFMVVGFINNVSAENKLLENRRSDAMQRQISAYILMLKQSKSVRDYPFHLERRLIESIERHDRDAAQDCLNKLLGAVLFADGGSVGLVKTRVYELLVVISRAAIASGSDADKTLQLSHEHLQSLLEFQTVESLCLWLSTALNGFMDELFTFSDAKHANVIHRCVQLVSQHYARNITLNEIARAVHLSPSYLSRIFKQETGSTFNEYLNRVRINRAKELMQSRDLRMSDISQMVGYSDQSHFTKVFKRLEGDLPRSYRDKHID